MRKIISLILIAAFSFALQAAPSQLIIPLSSSIYDRVDILYSLQGKVRPSTSRPWSYNEFKSILNNIDYNTLNDKEKILYSKIVEDPSVRNLDINLSDNAYLSLNLQIALESYAHTEGGIKVKTEDKWYHDADERLPFAKGSIELAIGDFYTLCDAQYGLGRTYNLDSDSFIKKNNAVGAIVKAGEEYYLPSSVEAYAEPIYFNLPKASKYFDFEWPKRAIFSVGGDNWNLNFSRDRINWGSSIIGNLVIDNHVDFHEYLRYKLFSKNVNYEALIVFFDSTVGSGEVVDDSFRMLLAHQLEFRIFDNLYLSMNDEVMYVGKSLNLRYLNPAFIFHNLNNRSMFNALMNININWAFLPNFELYTQLVLDQGRAPNEDGSQSSAYGAELGLKHSANLNGNFLTNTIEVAYLTPCMYRRDLVDFLMFRQYFTIGPSYVMDFDYIGFPYGGDTLAIKAQSNLFVPNWMTVNLSDTVILKGEIDLYKSVNLDGDESGKSNYGDHSFKNGVKTVTNILDLTIQGEPFSDLKIQPLMTLAWINKIAIDPAYSSEAYNDIQLSVGMKLEF